MTEFNKIIRYVFPVSIYLGYTIVFINISLLPEVFFYNDILDIDLNLTISVAFVGGLGFLISMLHHFFFWNIPFYPKTKYRVFIIKLLQTKLLKFDYSYSKKTNRKKRKIINSDSNTFYKKIFAIINKIYIYSSRVYILTNRIVFSSNLPLHEQSLWRIINVIWHRLRVDDKELDKINSRNDSLTDLMHGSGSALIALFLSIATTFIYDLYYINYINTLFCFDFKITNTLLITISILIYIHYSSYLYTVKNLNNFVESALTQSLSIHTNSKLNWFERKGPLIYYLHKKRKYFSSKRNVV